MSNVESGLSGWLGAFRRSLATVLSGFNGIGKQSRDETEALANQRVEGKNAPLDWYSATHSTD